MIFVNSELPRGLQMGALRKSGWSTTVVKSISGAEITIQNWSKTQHSFDLSHAIRTAADFDAVAQHFHTMRGKAKKFPFRDPLDNSCTVARGALVQVTAYTAYTLAKTYGSGGDAYLRAITRPTGVSIFRTRTGATTDITSSCTVSATTGAVSITGGVVLSGDTVAWSGSFFVPVRFDIDELPAVAQAMSPGGDLLVTCDNLPLVEVRE